MGKIVAIGGGEIGRPGHKIETEIIDKEIINLTNKKNPKLLFIPTASGDNQGYIDVINKYFGERLNCKIEVLNLINNELTFTQIKNKILNSDIIYVGGGDSKKMLDVWKNKKVDILLREAFKKEIILSGVSAGAICWFEFGFSDSINYKFENNPSKFTKLNCLNIISGFLCPHFDVETERETELRQFLENKSDFVIALDNCVAIEIVDNKFKIIKSKKEANAYKVYWKNNIYKKEIIDNEEYLDISNLFNN